jgi:hypothetical protein
MQDHESQSTRMPEVYQGEQTVCRQQRETFLPQSECHLAQCQLNANPKMTQLVWFFI